MSKLREILIRSGVVDRNMVQLFEQWGTLPPGSSEEVVERAKAATRTQMETFAEEVAEEVEKDLEIRETQLDLDQLRWPVYISIYPDLPRVGGSSAIASKIPALRDLMGDYYFRTADLRNNDWLTPGYYLLVDENVSKTPDPKKELFTEQLQESKTLYSGETPVAVRVTTDKAGRTIG